MEELKRFNARRKLKGAVQAIAGGVANDPLCGTDTDSGTANYDGIKEILQSETFRNHNHIFFAVIVGIASETLNDWADEEAGLEAVQRILDSMDDIHALQDLYVDEDVISEMLVDGRLHALLQVLYFWTSEYMQQISVKPSDMVVMKTSKSFVHDFKNLHYIRESLEVREVCSTSAITWGAVEAKTKCCGTVEKITSFRPSYIE